MGEKRVLVVDDEENMRHMLTELLKGEEYAVDAAGNGKEALGRLEESEFDLVLCDVRMPTMDGLAFLKEVGKRKLESAPDADHSEAVRARARCSRMSVRLLSSQSRNRCHSRKMAS